MRTIKTTRQGQVKGRISMRGNIVGPVLRHYGCRAKSWHTDASERRTADRRVPPLLPALQRPRRSEVEGAAAAAEIEFHLSGTVIFSQGAKASLLRVIRAGAVEIVHAAGSRPDRGGRDVRPRLDALGSADRLRRPSGRGHPHLQDPGSRGLQAARPARDAALCDPVVARRTATGSARAGRTRWCATSSASRSAPSSGRRR